MRKTKIRKTVIVLSLWVLGLVTPSMLMGQEAFDTLTEALEKGTVFSAEFSHQFIDAYTEDTVESQGEIDLNKQGYHVVMDARTILVQDSVSKVYNKANNQVIISRYVPEDDDFAPSRLIYASKEEYRIEEKLSEQSTLIELTARDPFAVFKSVTMEINSDGLPSAITAVDQAENTNITRFRNGRLSESEKQSFSLSYPDDAEVIDLRTD